MKKAMRTAAAAALVLGSAWMLAGCGGSESEGAYAGQTLHIYNWGEYTGENQIADFEALTGARVVMDNFESNEQMYIKVANGDSFDILVPSDYMIERLIQEDLFRALHRAHRRSSGVVRLGIEALELKAKGMSGREIAALYGVKPNHVGAWISRAASRLRRDQDLLRTCGPEHME